MTETVTLERRKSPKKAETGRGQVRGEWRQAGRRVVTLVGRRRYSSCPSPSTHGVQKAPVYLRIIVPSRLVRTKQA